MLAFLTLKSWSFLMLLFVWILSITIYLFYSNRKKVIFKLIVIFTLFNVFLLTALNSKIKSNNKTYGILQENTFIYKQANYNNNIGEINQGNKALILTKEKEWSYVSFENGLKGWVQNDKIAIF
jgi:hypothetical protein